MPVSPQNDYDTDQKDSPDGGARGDEDRELWEHAGPRAQSEEIEAPEEEEAQQQRSLRTPEQPTKEEVADHRANGHVPYRSWCPDCVEAFGREWAHRHGEGRSLPVISCDYLFITPRGAFRRGEVSAEEQEAALKVLAAYCSDTRSIFAHAVPKKGVDERSYIAEQLKQDVLWLGHAKIVLKRDNEPSLVQVMDALAGALNMAGLTSVTNEGSVP